MEVYLTDSLEQLLGVEATAFCNAFRVLKFGRDNGEYTSEVFGKDSAYTTPLVGGKKYVLRHVHLKPREPSLIKRWMAALGRKGRKTSNRALVYVEANGDFLLIGVLENAHEVAAMQTRDSRDLMQEFAEIAEAFQDGSIIA